MLTISFPLLKNKSLSQRSCAGASAPQVRELPPGQWPTGVPVPSCGRGWSWVSGKALSNPNHPMGRLPTAALCWLGVGSRGRWLRNRDLMLSAFFLLSYGKTEMFCAVYLQWSASKSCKVQIKAYYYKNFLAGIQTDMNIGLNPEFNFQ